MDYSKHITGYDELMSFATSQDKTQYELWYLFACTTDEVLKELYSKAVYSKTGYCYDPEVKAEYNRRLRYDKKRFLNKPKIHIGLIFRAWSFLDRDTRIQIPKANMY